MSLQQRPLTAYFGAPDSKFTKGIAAVPVSNAKKTNLGTKADKENEVPGSNASKIETAKGSPSVNKVVKTTKSSAAKDAGASPTASTTGPSPSAKANKKAKSTSSTARKVPVARKSKTAKKAPPASKEKIVVSCLSLSPKKPTAGARTPPTVKKLAKPSELLSTDTPGGNAAASKSVRTSTKKQARKVMHSVSVDSKASTAKKTNTATAVPSATNEKQNPSNESPLLKPKKAGTKKTSPAAPKVTKASKSESTVVSDIISIKEPPSAEQQSSNVTFPKSKPVLKVKTEASYKSMFTAKASLNSSKAPPSMGGANDSAESNPSNDAVISPSSPGRSTTKGTRVKPTKRKAPVARKTKAAKSASPALKAKNATSSKTSRGKSISSDRKALSFVPTTDPTEHQFAQSASQKVISSATNGITSIKCSRSVDDAIEKITPPEANQSFSSSNATSESGVMPHLTIAIDVLRDSTKSTEVDARDATPLSVSMGSIVSASEMSSRQRAGNTLSIVENVVEKLPRISAKLTLAMLKEEAVCRGLVLSRLPRTKMDLLSHLVDGSIHLTGTQAWKEVEALKAKMREEQVERDKKKREDEQKLEGKRREEEIESLALLAKMHEEQQALANERRAKEIESQTALHIHKYPRIHLHPLAQTTELLMNGMRRAACCELCSRHQPMQWTCEMCNFDICCFCFKENNMTDEERERDSQEQERRMIVVAQERAKERQEFEQRMKLLHELREADEKERKKKRETEKQNLLARARQQFKLAIICPSKKNEDLNGNNLKGFTVWCSLGEGWDGPPRKEFDSTWKSSADANSRARYLFFWKNTFEWDPEDVMPDEESEINGLVYYSVQPDDDQCWTVGVVPDVAFLHLPDASSDRHHHDREYDELVEFL